MEAQDKINEELDMGYAEKDLLSRQDIEHLTFEKRQEEADSRDNDISNGWTPEN